MKPSFVKALNQTGYSLRIIDEEGDEYNYPGPNGDFLQMTKELDEFTVALIGPSTNEIVGSFFFVGAELNDHTCEPLTESLSRHA